MPQGPEKHRTSVTHEPLLRTGCNVAVGRPVERHPPSLTSMFTVSIPAVPIGIHCTARLSFRTPTFSSTPPRAAGAACGLSARWPRLRRLLLASDSPLAVSRLSDR